MAEKTDVDSELAFSGEVWTDGRGFATVALPRASRALRGDLAYKLQPFIAGVTAVIGAEFIDGRFTIVTDEPHVKVAWRVSGHRPTRLDHPPTRSDS